MAPLGCPDYVYVSIVSGNQVTVSVDADTAEANLHEMVHSEIINHVANAKSDGDVRKSISIRTCYVELRRSSRDNGLPAVRRDYA